MSSRTSLPADLVAQWTARITREAEGLDLRLEDDRVTFRSRVEGALEDASYIRLVLPLSTALRARPRCPGRAGHARAIAEVWIGRAAGWGTIFG